ncbi:hypothetical protein D6817_01765 [Candidatus Pacearchaeota archaeon]|nr:MAG: hypothetical protein D6817_01765 [Candidatus Pacearchaeota archaeon]
MGSAAKEVLAPHEAQEFIASYVRVAKSVVLGKEAREVRGLKLPLVLKLSSRELVHKSELGAVRFAHTDEEARRAIKELREIARKARVKSYKILAQEKLSGIELLIGLKKDEVFGHVIVLGTGGIYTELIGDISIRKCPISVREAEEMLAETLVGRMLRARGANYNSSFLKRTLVQLSRVPFSKKGERILEMDINPFILSARDGKAVDVRVVLAR